MDLITFVKSLGYLGIWGIIFAESGILLAVMLPGDSLLFASGFLAAHGKLDIYVVTFGCFMAAVLGNCCGYYIGKRVGRKAFEKEEDGRFLKKSHIEKTEAFFAKYGRATIIVGRFLPVVRTFAPFLAGVIQMPFRIFLMHSIIGALLWVGSLCFLGHYLGKKIQVHEIEQYLTIIVSTIVFILLCPTIYHLIKRRRAKSLAKKMNNIDC